MSTYIEISRPHSANCLYPSCPCAGSAAGGTDARIDVPFQIVTIHFSYVYDLITAVCSPAPSVGLQPSGRAEALPCEAPGCRQPLLVHSTEFPAHLLGLKEVLSVCAKNGGRVYRK